MLGLWVVQPTDGCPRQLIGFVGLFCWLTRKIQRRVTTSVCQPVTLRSFVYGTQAICRNTNYLMGLFVNGRIQVLVRV